MIRLARPWIEKEEIAAASAVLESGMLVQGARVAAFEAALARRCERTHGVACGSGTAALELALSALDVAGGDVLCPGLTWPSPALAILRAGARPVLVDVDPRTWNASAEALRAARTPATRAIVVIDQFGTPADARAIVEALPDLPLVVDAACSLGATLGGRAAGSFGLVACLSFHPRKLVTTGEGGACVTDDAALAERLRVMRNHGQRGPGDFVEPAGNQRLTEVAAAIGLAQLERLDAILERRRALAERYLRALDGRFEVQQPPEGASSNRQTFGVILPASLRAADRDSIATRMRERGVEAGRLSYALSRVGSLAGRTAGGPLPVAEAIDERGLALPLHPLLSESDVDRVLEVFDSTMREVPA